MYRYCQATHWIHEPVSLELVVVIWPFRETQSARGNAIFEGETVLANDEPLPSWNWREGLWGGWRVEEKNPVW